MSKRLIFLLVGLCTMFALPAFAVDGVTLINQATVNAAGGFPYKITQPGSYKLSGNLSVTTGSTHGIDINADNVVLDLNGFSITSVDTTCTGTPVTSCTYGTAIGIICASKNVTVRNGTVTGFQQGFNLNGIGNLLEEVHASGNFIGASLAYGIVRRSTFTGNFEGLSAYSAVVQDNFASGNSAGIVIGRSNFSGNVVSGNSNYGINTNSSNYGNNLFFGNGSDLIDGGGNTSQHNNNCSGTVC